MHKIIHYIFLILLLTCLMSATLPAQMEGLRGDFMEVRNGEHAGNLFRTTFYNDGTFGRLQNPPDIAGEWPINSGHYYLIDGNLFVGGEVIDAEGQVKHIISTVRSSMVSWSTGDTSPDGDWWTFLPLPGFAARDTNKIAMSKWPWAWPDVWPDKMSDPVDPGWPGAWNGYFGKDFFNADEESYFVADDYNNREFLFWPDTTDSLRRGLGLRMYTRGFQWSNALVEDALFVLFDLENVGTHNHDKMVFGYKFGNNMGDSDKGGDGGDDMGGFDKESDSAFLYDFDDIGGGNWTPVGYFGGAFLESPGNPFDGIDNDGDGAMGSGGIIDESMFVPKTLKAGDEVIVIDYETFEREKIAMPDDTLEIAYQDLIFKFWPGKTVEEVPHNLVDDNLNGIIDENSGAEIGEGADAFTSYLYIGLKYIDYFTGNGLDNTMLDERRDDGIDNDGDWDPAFDDVGQDGKAFTGDPGEGDGVPTNGEPHFDKTDIDETDMIGLTSFTLYLWPDIPHYEDEKVWDNITPGFFDDEMLNENIELLYGSGYFPVKAGTTERFSMGIICGIDRDDFLENVKWVSKAYNENYNFSKAPNIPNVEAIASDGKVTLIWDTIAEESEDPITGKDFEGYKIYRSTDPGWNDAQPITDGQGATTYRKPLAQFDLDNEYEGFSPVHIKGIRFYLGDNSGIVNTFTDTTVTNGQKYYYAVTAYDRGAPDGGIAPTECSKFISMNPSGEVDDKGSNVVIVTPNAPSTGFQSAELANLALQEGGHTTGHVGYEIVDPRVIQDDVTYRITFEDTLIENENSWLVPGTKNFSLLNINSGDTLINKSDRVGDDVEQPITDGFQLKLLNEPMVELVPDSTMWMQDTTVANFEPDSAGRAPYVFEFEPYRYSRTQGVAQLYDYRIDFYDEVGVDTAMARDINVRVKTENIPVNFTVTNLSTGEPVPFALNDADVADGEDGMFSAFTGPRGRYADEIIFLEPNPFTEDTLSWMFTLDRASNDSLHRNPKAGDYFVAKVRKPFTSRDVFEFTTRGQRIEADLVNLDDIRVVPNPYVVTNSWEPRNPYSNGRGPRVMQFTHLPPQCTIKIFNIRGQLVRELNHNSSITNGAKEWDMQTKDQLDVSYGIYIYHIDAGEYGTKIGKFAVIK